jgi:hypothetical protein
MSIVLEVFHYLDQCFSSAGPRSITGPWQREIVLEFIILVCNAFIMNTYFIVEMFWGE